MKFFYVERLLNLKLTSMNITQIIYKKNINVKSPVFDKEHTNAFSYNANRYNSFDIVQYKSLLYAHNRFKKVNFDCCESTSLKNC